jgi:uncharacterized protein
LVALSVVIKISESCNLDCRYCYQGGRLRPQQTMPLSTLQRIFAELATVCRPPIHILWYGGEPTVVGLDYFRSALDEADRLLGSEVGHSIQSNGMLIDDSWAALLADRGVKVRLSMDGPSDLHDLLRPTVGGRGSHAKVLAGLSQLRARAVPARISCTVARASLGRAPELVRYFDGLGIEELDFSPALRLSQNAPEAEISGREFGEFMVNAMTTWLGLPHATLRIRSLAALIRKLHGQSPGYCKVEGDCGRAVTFGWDGRVYPCDEFSSQICLGQILKTPLQELLKVRPVAALGEIRSPDCQACRWEAVCPGSLCPFERVMNGGGARASVLCDGWKMVLEHIAWGLGGTPSLN